LGCADLLLRADGRRPGVLATDLLHPRADRADRLRLLRLGGVEGATPPLEERTGRRPRELRRDPPGRHLWRADAAYRLALGQDLMGALVAMEQEPARPLSRSFPLLRCLLHAAL